ncbi:hypothetical protein BCR44DRAFT_1441925, partial [Catenaria anguillulae PL171]
RRACGGQVLWATFLNQVGRTSGFFSTVSTSRASVLRVVEKAACGGRHALLVYVANGHQREPRPLFQVSAPSLTNMASEELSPQLQARD